MAKCDDAEMQVYFTTSRLIHKDFMDKVLLEGYTLSEALSFLMVKYIEEN